MNKIEKACKLIKLLIQHQWLALTEGQRQFIGSIQFFAEEPKWRYPQGTALFTIDPTGTITAKHDGQVFTCTLNQVLIHGNDKEAEFHDSEMESESLKNAWRCIELIMLYMTADKLIEAVKQDVREGLEEYEDQKKHISSWGDNVL